MPIKKSMHLISVHTSNHGAYAICIITSVHAHVDLAL